MNFFWIGTTLDDFLFQGLSISSTAGFAGLFIVLMISGCVYEVLRTIRDMLLHKWMQDVKANPPLGDRTQEHAMVSYQQNHNYGTAPCCNTNPPVTSSSSESSNSASMGQSSNRRRPRNVLTLVIASLIHMIVVWLSFTLMLAIMSFNVWVFVSVTIGVCGGFFVFGIRNQNYETRS